MFYEILKKVMYEIYNTTKKEIGILNEEKKIIIYKGQKEIKDLEKKIMESLSFTSTKDVFLNYCYLPLNLKTKHYIFIEGTDKESKNQLKIMKILIENALLKKQISKEGLIEKILKNEIYEKEIEKKAEILNIEINKKRVIILIKTKAEEYKIVRNFLKENLSQEDFLIELGNEKFVILKTIRDEKEQKILEYLKELHENLKEKTKIEISIAVGNFVENLKKIENSFKEATLALEIKQIFQNSDDIIFYNNIGIERIIYKLPISICEIFLAEVLKKKKIKNLNEEILFTINSFFDNNLNISETSRKLFIHRNTLVYRLEKIKNLTGLDLRNFEDAIKFKLALMIQKYLNFIAEKNNI